MTAFRNRRKEYLVIVASFFIFSPCQVQLVQKFLPLHILPIALYTELYAKKIKRATT